MSPAEMPDKIIRERSFSFRRKVIPERTGRQSPEIMIYAMKNIQLKFR